jgi:hypothetical protein
MRKLVPIIAALGLVGFMTIETFSFGKAKGLAEGMQAGYVQGLEDSTHGLDISKDADEVCIDGQCEARED